MKKIVVIIILFFSFFNYVKGETYYGDYRLVDDAGSYIEELLKIETINLFHNDRILHELLMQTTFLVNQLGLITDKNSILYGDEVGTFLDDDDIGFLGKDKKIKEKVANKLCETIITMLKEEIDEETKKEC